MIYDKYIFCLIWTLFMNKGGFKSINGSLSRMVSLATGLGLAVIPARVSWRWCFLASCLPRWHHLQWLSEIVEWFILILTESSSDLAFVVARMVGPSRLLSICLGHPQVPGLWWVHLLESHVFFLGWHRGSLGRRLHLSKRDWFQSFKTTINICSNYLKNNSFF